MTFQDENRIRRIKDDYPTGTRVELIFMDDPYAKLPPDTQGMVEHVDDIGTIHVVWDNGSTLGLVPGVDRFRNVLKPLPTRRVGIIEDFDESEFLRHVSEIEVLSPTEIGFRLKNGLLLKEQIAR